MFTNNFTVHTTAEEVAAALSRETTGKNGAALYESESDIDGIGFKTARVLANYANLVIITGYNAERCEGRTRSDPFSIRYPFCLVFSGSATFHGN